MSEMVRIVVIVWTVCFIICLADLSFGVRRALVKGWRVSWSKIVQMVYEALFMAPLVALLVAMSRLCEFADWMMEKTRRNEDEDL